MSFLFLNTHINFALQQTLQHFSALVKGKNGLRLRVCVLVGKLSETDVTEEAETSLSADLAQHLQAESAHYSKCANYHRHDRVTPRYFCTHISHLCHIE